MRAPPTAQLASTPSDNMPHAKRHAHLHKEGDDRSRAPHTPWGDILADMLRVRLIAHLTVSVHAGSQLDDMLASTAAPTRR